MKKALNVIFNVIVWVFLAFSVAVTAISISAANNDGLPSIFGKIPITVLSDSMKPTFKKGDLIIDKKLDGEARAELKKDDIITFYTDLNSDGVREINTHRIVDKTEQNGYVFYTTKGDNTETNTGNDKSLVRYDMIVGQYSGTKIPGLGKIMSFLQTSKGFLLCIVLPLILFFLYELYRFIVTVVASKSKKALTKEEEDEIKKKAVEEYLKQQNDDGDDSVK